MRKIQYLSPTSISIFENSTVEFYLQYMAEDRPPRFPQTQPMSVGSAFDAYVKSYLHQRIFGVGNDPKFDLQAIFEAQVETQNRDFAFEAGKHCFEEYKNSGALSDLLLELGAGIGKPRFEFEVKGVVDGKREGVTLDLEGGVVLLGKPDVFYVNKLGAHVTHDFKVNGYCSNYTISPMPGYVKLRQGKTNKGHHKDCQLMSINGVMVNISNYLEDKNQDWATQLSIYSWLMGMDVGSEFIAAIDQIVCTPSSNKQMGMAGPGDRPDIRIAEHRMRVSKDYQWGVFARCQKIWEIIHSDHFFREMTKEESQARCKLLDGTAEALRGDGTERDRWFAESVNR